MLKLRTARWLLMEISNEGLFDVVYEDGAMLSVDDAKIVAMDKYKGLMVTLVRDAGRFYIVCMTDGGCGPASGFAVKVDKESGAAEFFNWLAPTNIDISYKLKWLFNSLLFLV